MTNVRGVVLMIGALTASGSVAVSIAHHEPLVFIASKAALMGVGGIGAGLVGIYLPLAMLVGVIELGAKFGWWPPPYRNWNGKATDVGQRGSVDL